MMYALGYTAALALVLLFNRGANHNQQGKAC
jgi:hypothetical protein